MVNPHKKLLNLRLKKMSVKGLMEYEEELRLEVMKEENAVRIHSPNRFIYTVDGSYMLKELKKDIARVKTWLTVKLKSEAVIGH